MNADLRQASRSRLGPEGKRFGWHRFRHSPSTWANETTKDITVSQTMLRHAKPDTTAIYTYGNFGEALDAQRLYKKCWGLQYMFGVSGDQKDQGERDEVGIER